jgi:hypothetical protein
MQKLELTWIGKGHTLKGTREPMVELRILLRDASKDYAHERDRKNGYGRENI